MCSSPPRTAGAPPPRNLSPRQGQETQGIEAVLSRPEGRALYRRRQQIVEPVFAHTKVIRRSDRFLRRGLAACQAEWQLIAATHNLLKLWRAGAGRARRSPNHFPPDEVASPAPRAPLRPETHNRPPQPPRETEKPRTEALCDSLVCGGFVKTDRGFLNRVRWFDSGRGHLLLRGLAAFNGGI